MGCTRGPIRLWSEGPKATGAPLYAECSSVCSWFEPGGFYYCVLVNLIDLMNLEALESTPLNFVSWERAHPLL